MRAIGATAGFLGDYPFSLRSAGCSAKTTFHHVLVLHGPDAFFQSMRILRCLNGLVDCSHGTAAALRPFGGARAQLLDSKAPEQHSVRLMRTLPLATSLASREPSQCRLV